MRSLFKIFIFVATVSVGLLLVLNDKQEVLIESLESKTQLGDPVFNKIKWFQYKDKDVWMMNQSHFGLQADGKAWDRLAIVIDKTESPARAHFFQLEPGSLEWKENLVRKPFKVACFMCHSNGPRVIRPNTVSPFDPTSWKDRIKITYWNLRIKLYGRVLPHHDNNLAKGSVPFRFIGAYENEPLKVATCVKCHRDEGWFARGELRRQQLPTIRFMLESGQMPPLGFSLTNSEKSDLQNFLDGF